MKGNFWKGAEIKRTREKYAHIRRKMQRNRQLHIVANQIVAYAKQFPKPIIVMEDLTGIRTTLTSPRSLTGDFILYPSESSKPIEYKALLEGIEVRYLPKKEVRNTSKTCHRCGHAARVNGRDGIQ
ncbi:MAG: IS200/IS605 family element transposase accessory protein TnpB [Archaeoglobales archaeon]|nr:IS200/IS605 family element transposase accessory protein TnpB [Archaeoglobales archaeon]